MLYGLRKAAARRLAESGSPYETKAITGHKSLEEVERYTRAVKPKKVARAAVTRLEEHDEIKNPNRTPKPFELLASVRAIILAAARHDPMRARHAAFLLTAAYLAIWAAATWWFWR